LDELKKLRELVKGAKKGWKEEFWVLV
jgi:hypothetical protein